MSATNHSRSRAIFWLQAASLLATGWLVWESVYVPFGAGNYLPEALAIALWFSFCALALSGVITYLLLLVVRRITHRDVWNITLRTCAAGMWFAPAVILFVLASPFAIMAALALVVSVTRILYAQWIAAPEPEGAGPETQALEATEGDAPPSPAPLPAKVLTGGLPHGFLPRDFWPAFISAAALQAGFVFARLEDRSLSSVCYVVGASVLTAYGIAAGVWRRDREPTLPRSVMAIAVTLMLTVLITILGMQLPGGGGDGGTASRGSASVHRPQPPPPPPPPPVHQAKYEPPPIDPKRMGPAVNVPGGVPGVILWPETEAVPLLIEPMPKGGLANRPKSHPFVIPFSGAYWMFRSGFTRPPANSLVRRGVPTTTSFRTVDSWPLEMEAHQQLDREIDLSCCSTIRVEVLNADPFPTTLTVELGLIYHGGNPIRLGRDLILSKPDLMEQPVKPVAETLEYPIPPFRLRFDEFDVIFHRQKAGLDHSARVAIQRFVLVPR